MSQPETARPNILILFSDQLRADVLGAYGDTVVDTPAMDALADSGVVFQNAYTPTPVCVPARSAFITGIEPQHGECFENGDATAAAPTFMDALSEAGYRTHGIGKMHFTPDLWALRGFESREVGEEFGPRDRDDYFRHVAEQGFGSVEKPLGLRDEMYYIPQLSPVPEHLHHSHWVADRSIAFLGEQTADRPFLLWSSFIAPHPPFSPPSPWHRKYEPSVMPEPFVPQGSDGLRTIWNDLQNRYKFRDGGDDRRVQQLIRAYYFASVAYLDSQMARILDELDELGLRDNTYVLLTADHGELLGDYGSWGKRSFLDAAARVPFLLAGPGIEPGSSDAPVTLTDAYATLLELAGIGAQNGSGDRDGVNALTAAEDRVVYGQYQRADLGLYAVISREWKYTWSAYDRREYLVDRVHDPRETMNLAYNYRRRDDLLRMRRLASDHFDDLSTIDWDAASGNDDFRFGRAPDDASRRTLDAIARDRDAATLIVAGWDDLDD